jgi:TatD DNase family protein
MQYIDIHTHVNLAAFKDDADATVLRALEHNVGLINIGTQYDTSVRAVEMLNKYPDGVYATVGLHPIHTGGSSYDEQEFDDKKKEFTTKGEVFDAGVYRKLAQHERVVAIGECGLDYFRNPTEEAVRKQIEAFEAQIALANEVNKPLMLHLRNGNDRNAYEDAYQILKRQANVSGNSHFFAGALKDAVRFWELGYSISFTGVITFTHDYDEVVREAPKNLIHAETDAPYVAPVPYRGKRNEPLYVREVVEKMAEIRGVSLDEFKLQLLQNAHDFFAITH